jgi:serine/threonine protein kinase
MSGTVIGSPEYMSPEQARGLGDVDQTTDVWSLSVVLFEMITGFTPFHREEGTASILHAITDEPAMPLAAHGIHEPELQAILDQGLSKFRAARFGDMRAFGTSLARWLLSKAIEEDVSGQSIRAVWFGSHASAPPVAIDAHPKRELLPRILPLDDDYTPPSTNSGWSTAIVVSVLAVGVALGVGLYARQLFRHTEVAGVVEPPTELPVGTGVRSDSVLAAPEVNPVPPAPSASAPVASAASVTPPNPLVPSAKPPVAPEASPLSQPAMPPATSLMPKRVVPSRPVEAIPHPAYPEPAPPGVDVADLPSVFTPPAAEPSAPPPPGTSSAPGEGTPPQDRHDGPKASDLRNPYPTDNPY